MEVIIIIGAGIGGLTLALMLHRAGIACRVFEAAPEMRPIGVGINLLPHAMRELAELGLEPALAGRGVLTSEAVFFNRYGLDNLPSKDFVAGFHVAEVDVGQAV